MTETAPIDLSDRIALVTGASKGIGAACTLELARRGAQVIALARTQGALEELDDQVQKETGKSLTLIPMDLTKFSDIDALGASIYERFGKLDIFIGCAGKLGILTPAHHLEHKDLEKTMRLNFTANVRLIRSLHPLLNASSNAHAIFPSGKIAEMPPAYFGAYSASKAALETFVKSYRAEIGKTNIRAQILRLPPTKTDLLAEGFPGGFPGKTISPEQAAQAFIKAIAAPEASNAAIINYENI